MDRVTSMRTFVRAAADGSLSAAGRHLGISPAMAVKHVNALEARLGVKLFHRTTRRLSLTEAGSNYLEACQRILPEIDEAEAAAASQRIKATGLLRMNVPLSFGSRFVAPLVPEFSRRHPEVRVELGLSDAQLDLIAGNWDLAIRIGRLAAAPLSGNKATGLLRMNGPRAVGSRLVEPLVPEFSRRHPEVRVELGLSDAQLDLIAGNWDLAIRIGRLADSPLHARRLGDSTMHVCAAAAYLDRRGVPRRVAELIQHNCLSYTLSAMQEGKRWAFGPRGDVLVPLTGDLMANNDDR